MHQQPLYRDYRVVGGAVADALFDQGLCLPSVVTADDVGRVVDAIEGTPGARVP